MKTATYLIPMEYAWFCGKPFDEKKALPMRYRIQSAPLDMRKKFCKNHEKNRIENVTAVLEAAAEAGMIFKKDDYTILYAPNAEMAKKFKKALQKVREQQ